MNYNKFVNTILQIKEKHLPTKLVKFNKYKHKFSPWVTNSILRSIKYKDKLYKTLKSTEQNDPQYQITKYNLKIYSRILDKVIHQRKRDYYHNLFDRFKANTRKTWDTIKSVLNINKKKRDFPLFFKVNSTKVTNKAEIASRFNQFFTEIGPKLATKLHSTNLPLFSTYLTDNHNVQFNFTQVSEDDIKKILDKLKPKVSTGHDEISVKLLKGGSSVIAEPLALIINQSFNRGIFPKKLKLAKVLPVYKKGDNSIFDNYRPISLLPALSKVFEKVVYHQIFSFFSSHNLFYESQHGFKEGHSTETAALELIDRIYQILDSGEIPICIYLDLSKAFDTLDHGILLEKLSYYGIRGTALDWFRSYLTQRSQYVEYGSECSDPLPISTGVPQGSILGPLLFIIYMNDIHFASPKFKTLLYADDTTLVNSLNVFNDDVHPDAVNLSNNVNTELNRVFNWLTANKLSLNVSKTRYMVFHFPQRKLNFNLEIKLNDTLVEMTDDFDFLGLTIQENLSWKAHINKIAMKISRCIGILKRLHHFLPVKSLLLIYNSLLLTHLNYSILAWGHSCNRIVKLQKKAIRLINSANFVAHTEPLFKELNLMKFEDLLRLKALKFYYKHYHNKMPKYFNNFFTTQSITHPYNTRHRHVSRTVLPHRISTKYRIRYYIPNLLNEMPICIKEKFATHSYYGFSKYTRLYFTNQYSEICSIQNCYICNN